MTKPKDARCFYAKKSIVRCCRWSDPVTEDIEDEAQVERDEDKNLNNCVGSGEVDQIASDCRVGSIP